MGGGDNRSVLAAAGLCPALVFGAASAIAQDDREHALVLKLGPAGEWPSHERANFGGTFAVEKAADRKLVGNRGGLDESQHDRPQRIIGRYYLQKALSYFSYARIHDWCGAINFENAQRRGSIHHRERRVYTRFHVLANPKHWLVCGADLDRQS